MDIITTVNARVDGLMRSGWVASALSRAALCGSSAKTSGRDKNEREESHELHQSSNRRALVAVDTHLRRRRAFEALDANMACIFLMFQHFLNCVMFFV
jgi:hypothetical protein